MIPVTKPFLPPRAEYERYLDGIWNRNWLTNHGPLVNDLELKLKKYLGIDHLLYLANGTLGLQIAIKALELKGEVITTPFSYVATSSSLVWEGCQPVFVDIDPSTFNIDPSKIEAAITDNTTGIMATHVFGNPCEIERIEAIARKHNLKLIYDAAHGFGVTYNSKPLVEYGDISVLSFHATKLYHTVEGGAVVTKQPELLKRMAYLRNFGHEGTEAFNGVGINGKNSEFHAAMGLCNLKYIDGILERYKANYHYYLNWLSKSPELTFQKIHEGALYNYAYFPVLFESENTLKKVKAELEKHQIFPRRYFYPSLDTLEYIREQEVPIARNISSRILCLPMSFHYAEEELEMVCRIVLRTLKFSV
ncbi:MAG: DegT/DnrJ/EryC1/StrS family aminotransferase [Cyclobacteriaceae bacterium]|nr:DegT/DnrJ/EryC1/StrS family aminotransferase [Cyclobacteriaceae bacterium]